VCGVKGKKKEMRGSGRISRIEISIREMGMEKRNRDVPKVKPSIGLSMFLLMFNIKIKVS